MKTLVYDVQNLLVLDSAFKQFKRLLEYTCKLD